jgi:hypothetical protein
VVIYVVFSRVLGPATQRRKLQEAGEPAEATVLGISDTGMTLNRIYPYVQMDLEVRPPGRPAYRVSSKFLINRLDVPRFQPGTVVHVMIDRTDPDNVALAGSQAGEPTQPGATERESEEMLKKVDAANQDLITRSTAAEATILQAWEMGISVNGPNPAMKFLLQVSPAGQQPFQSEATAVVSEASVSKYQPGKTVYVKYDPGDTTRVAIEHS